MLDFKDLITSTRPDLVEDVRALLKQADPSVVRLCLQITTASTTHPLLAAVFAPLPGTPTSAIVDVILSGLGCKKENCKDCVKGIHLWWDILRAYAVTLSGVEGFSFNPLNKAVISTDPTGATVATPIMDPEAREIIDKAFSLNEDKISLWAKQDRKSRNWALQQQNAAMN